VIDLDITTTATLRPDILQRTYQSFTDKLLKPGIAKYHCVLHIDRIGMDVIPTEVLAVARSFFDDVTWRISDNPNFGLAQKWTWSHSRSEFLFNLEDDWQLIRDVDLSEMLSIMQRNPTLAHLRLSTFPTKTLPEGSRKGSGLCLRQWNAYIPWNGEFFEVPQRLNCKLGYSNCPSLVRGEFARNVAIYFRDDYSPEKTLKGRFRELRKELSRWRFGAYQEPHTKSSGSIRDIGRKWREENDFFKHRGFGFKTWQKAPMSEWRDIQRNSKNKGK